MKKYEKIFNSVIASNTIHEAVIYIENSNGDFSFYKGYGNKDLDSPLLMASITKLFTTTCIFVILEKGKLTLDDKIKNYFDESVLRGLHVFRGKEYSFELTISDLLFQISGLPDVYEEGENSYKSRVIAEDFRYTFSELVAKTKHAIPHFKPRTIKRAYYADVNFDLLGQIIENVMNGSLSEIYRRYIFEPLDLRHTYLTESKLDFVPNIYYKNRAILRPEFIMSSRASGGCVTTAREMMKFLKAFFSGKLFNISVLDDLSAYNKLQASMMPICYGSGYMRIPLNSGATLFMGKGELMGHTGSTGSFAFYYPSKELYMIGDLNQMMKPALPVRLAMRVAMAAK